MRDVKCEHSNEVGKSIVLLTNRYEGLPLSVISENIPDNFELIMLDKVTEDDLLCKISSANYLLVSGRLKINDKILSRAHSLKMIQRTGVGVDMLDKKAITKYGIPVYINYGVNSRGVAEHTILLILAALRKLTMVDQNVKSGIWEKQNTGLTTHELNGKTIGLIGLGIIGRTVVDMLKPFNVHILYYDICAASSDVERELGITYMPLKKLLPLVDVLSLHCPLNESTLGMIGEGELSLMKSGSIIVNTARGGLIDEGALLSALRMKKISFAALDVHAKEPIDKCSSMCDLANVILTPHIGGVTYESFNLMMKEAIVNIQMFENGEFDRIAHKKIL